MDQKLPKGLDGYTAATMASSQPNMVRFLRDWRQDALNKAQYDAAIFVGDKVLAMTSEPPLLSSVDRRGVGRRG